MSLRVSCLLPLLVSLGLPALSDTVVAARTIRANTVLTASDMRLISDTIPGMVTEIAQASGMEARTNLYAGRPIRLADIGPPATIERNQIITLIYAANGLKISTEGRALARGGVGDRMRVMNLTSRNTVYGRVDESGAVRVGQ